MKNTLFLFTLIACGSQIYAASEPSPRAPISKASPTLLSRLKNAPLTFLYYPNIECLDAPFHYKFSLVRCLGYLNNMLDTMATNLSTKDRELLALIKTAKDTPEKINRETHNRVCQTADPKHVSWVARQLVTDMGTDLVCDSLAPIISEQVDYYCAGVPKITKIALKCGIKSIARIAVYNVIGNTVDGWEEPRRMRVPKLGFYFNLEL